MFSGYIMTLHTHGIKEGSKEETPDEAKVKEEEKVKAKAEEAEDTSNQEDQRAKEREEEKTALIWWEKKDMKKTGKKKKNGMIPVKAIGPTIKTGMMPSGQKICATRMSMVTSRRKEKARKERKVRKERMMKEKENQEMAKASQTMFSHQLHQILLFKTNNSNRLITLQQPQVQGMVLLPFLELTQYVLMY